MTRSVTLSLLIAGSLTAILGSAGRARADVIYTYTGSPTYQGQNSEPAVGTTLTLDVTDAAVASGSFTLSGYGSLDDVSYTGDVSGLVSFVTPGPFTATPTSIDGGGSFSLSFTFDSAGNILSDTVEYYGLDASGQLSGSGSLTTGSIGSADLGCDSDASSGVCTVSGSWTTASNAATAVPEAGSFFVLCSACLITLALKVRQRLRRLNDHAGTPTRSHAAV